jgi:hypothetical protein
VPPQPERIGKYEILCQLGRGGMGTVFKARDPVLDRVIALKTMAADALAEAGMRERFLREARSAARLQHPNIVTVYEFGEVGGAPFISMEYLEGENLAAVIDRKSSLDLGGKLGVVSKLCDGLGYAHQHGVIHRDVKPTNVIILPGGGLKIVDFGIAWLEGGTLATKTGQLLGTPSYMAPEQFAGVPIDHRVDIWAVGVILYELLSGRRPFDAGTVPSLIYQIVHASPAPIDRSALHLPDRLVAIVERALAKEPRERFQDLETMAATLRSVQAEISTAVVVAPAAPSAEPAEPAPSRSVAAPLAAAGATERLRTAARTPIPRHAVFVDDGVFGEARSVHVAALSLDDSLLAAGGTDGSIRLWDVATRQKIATLRNREHLRSGHGSLTTALAFSPDGALLASGHLDGAIYLWEIATGLELDVKLAHEGQVGGLAFPPGDALLVSGGADATLKFWELAAVRTGDARRTLRRQPDAVSCLALARSGQAVITGHTNRVVRVHGLSDYRLLSTLHGHHAPVSAIAVAPVGELLASGARDGAVRVHDLASREPRGLHQEHPRAVADVAFFPDGRRVASVAMDSAVVIWDLADPEDPITLPGQAGESFTGVRVTADGRRLICATADGHFRTWLLPG